MVTALRRTTAREPIDVDGEHNDGDDKGVEHTGDYDDDRVRDQATGAQRSSSEEVADINNTMPTVSYEHMVQTDEEPVTGIIELPLQLISCTDNITPPDTNAAKDYHAPRLRLRAREKSPMDAAITQAMIFEVD